MTLRIGGEHQPWRVPLPERCAACGGKIRVVDLGGNPTVVCAANCDQRPILPAYRELRRSGAPTLPGFGDDEVAVTPKKRTRKQHIA